MVPFFTSYTICKDLVLLCDLQVVSQYECLRGYQVEGLHVFTIVNDIPFDIGRVTGENSLERMERVANIALGFPSLIIELCQLSLLLIKENKDKTPHYMPLSVESLKTKARKSMRRHMPIDVPDYVSGREVSNEEGGEESKEEQEEEEMEAAVEVEKEESDEIPPLGHQRRLVIQNINDMLYDHH